MNDKWLRVIGIPVVGTVMHVVFDGWPRVYDGPLLEHYLFGLFITLTLWEGNRANFLLMRRLLPRYEQTTRRLVLQTLGSVGFTLVASVFLNELHRLLLGAPLCAKGEFFSMFLLKLVPTFMVTSVYESTYFFGEWKKNLHRSEALARAGIQSELEALQRQLDPHFLFNSLNTLSALIEPDNEPAQSFVEQLSDVYRYVLLSRDRATVPLAEELKFVDAYLALNKTRFRDDLQVERDLSSATGPATVAPLSVQMLVENALKHNVISAESPLRLTLRTTGTHVSVANNVQPKTALGHSTKVGLQNIINRYRLLSERPVEVLAGPEFFTVRLPLLG